MLCPLVETPQLNRRATAVDLSEAAVRRRVQKLLDRGVMRIVAVTEPLTGGPRRRATKI
jgi:Lrp/AsnC family transcriptional regulator for asnA, asnC and gidA